METLRVNVDKQKYYKTEIGPIPVDWKVKKINEVADVNRNSLTHHIPEDYEFHYYDLSAVNRGKVNHPCKKMRLGDAPSRARRLFKKHDILMSTVRPNLQGFAYVDFDSKDCVCSTGFAIIESKNELDSMYLYQNLYSHVITNQINKRIVGSNYPAINGKDVENLKIPFPSDENERKKIVLILTTWDKAIELKEKLIEQKREQKKGLMQKLLTGKVRLPGFEEEWQELKISEFCTTYSDSTPSQTRKEYYENGTIPWIKSEELNLRKVTHTEEFITEKGLRNSSAKLVEPETILLALYGATAGVVAISKIRAAINQAILAISPNNNCNKNHLFSYLEYVMERVVKKYTQGGQPNLSAEIIKNLAIQLPSIEEQKAIADVLMKIDLNIELLEAELEQLKQQKQGLMQFLLTGKVRVQV